MIKNRVYVNFYLESPKHICRNNSLEDKLTIYSIEKSEKIFIVYPNTEFTQN